ncbi:type II toxin-antitoxin system RelE/ParE family toxin [Nostoc sp.]|uniref:type II toxin-antitoxin system RelE/ParE family toxin n=1 Tax=Nostoc sp. TaxID=1180 RepID=UPI003FA56D4F
MLWLESLGDLEIIIRYIAQDNPEAARKIGQRLLEKTKELSQFPFKRQKVSEFDDANIRQLILKPYRIIYRIEEEKKQVSITRKF